MVFCSPGNDTLFKYVKKLPAASVLKHDIGKKFYFPILGWPTYDPNEEFQYAIQGGKTYRRCC